MNTSDLKICILDLETLLSLNIIGGYIPHEDKWIMYELSHRKNELDGAVKWILESDIDYWVTYNGVRFDLQVLQYIIDNYQEWYNNTTKDVLKNIYTFVQEIINNQDYGIAPPYKEYYMDMKTIDLMLLLHYDNDAKLTS